MSFFKIATMLCLSVVMFACQPEQAETAKPQSEGSEATKNISAPVFSGTTLGGRTVSSKSLAGKAYIVNFFASWCPPCRAEMPDMVALQSEYEQNGFTFVGITVDEDLSKARAFVSDYGINFPVVVADQQILDTYSSYVEGGLRAIPTSFVVGADGSLQSVLLGPQSKMAFDNLIREAINAGG
ncbi:TlpA family protein disulfide reductase [Prosthecochloris sp. SCSIO W1101]|uniref:TlpA family protein disulfide reductase n=1 Tax=Prosthecochloris sp. SCSIO W1101 TaxID=2992242 RepID=UPI00223E4609|nr:TlpA disulfide reductase family protein [Prosthecochloris sp. SCSIO W1101]UZJ41472.1 TlpA family protein disulfide reductase [Prosthecochloris sp. SCSIO W1101]